MGDGGGFYTQPRPTPAHSWPKNLGQVLPTPIPHHEATPDPEAWPSAEQESTALGPVCGLASDILWKTPP